MSRDSQISKRESVREGTKRMAPSRRGTRSGSVGGAATEPGKKEREDGDAVARMGGTGASILREGSSKRMADALLDEESASFCKRSRSLPEELEDGQLAGDALKRLGSESGSVGENMSHHDHGEGSADGRSRRAGDDDEDAQEHEEKQEAEEDDMEEDEEEAEDDEGEADIEEVVKDDAVGREDEGFENQKEEVGEHKMDGDRGEECPEPPKDDEPKEEGKEETREEVRDDVVAVAIGVAAEAEKVAALGMSEEKLVEKELSVQDLIDKKDELDAHSQVAAPIQLQVTLSAQQSLSLSLEHKPEEKKENGSVEQKLAELPNGLQKLDEIHAVAPKQVHIHHMQHHQAPHPHQAPPQQLAPKPPPSVWGAHMGGSGGGPSFATMLASTNTFAAMLQTGLSPPANQQPISIKLAGTNAFSAVLAAGTFSSVLAQGQDGKDKGRCSTGGDKDDGSPDKSGIDKGESVPQIFFLRAHVSIWRRPHIMCVEYVS